MSTNNTQNDNTLNNWGNPPPLGQDNYDIWAPKITHVLDKENVLWVIEDVPYEPSEVVTALGYDKNWEASYGTFCKNVGAEPVFKHYVMKWNHASSKALRTIMAYSDPTRMQEVRALQSTLYCP